MAALGALTSALVWAMIGVLAPWTVGPTALLFCWAIFRYIPRSAVIAGAATPRWFWLLLLAALAGWSVWMSLTASELVLTGRDGATYLNIAKGLESGEDLLPRTVVPPFDDAQTFAFESPGWILRDDGRLYQQFLHAVPATWAVVGQVLGESALVRANVGFGAIALLAFFGLVRLWLPTPWAAGAVAVMAVSFPMVYYSRSTFTEPAAMALIAGGSSLLATVHRTRGSIGQARVAGIVLGGSTLVRIDAWMVGLALASAALVLASLNRRDDVRLANAVWTGFLGMSMLGMIDLYVFSRPYLSMHRTQMLGLIGATLLARLASGPTFESLRAATMKAIRSTTRAVPLLPTATMGAFMLWLFLLRPGLSVSYGWSYGLDGIEALEGIPTGTGRNYVESAGLWPAWYLGYPALIAALSWVCVLSRKREWSAHEVVLALIGLVPSLIYFIAPSVNPDHPWAMRRFLPIVLPLLVGLSWRALLAGSARLRLTAPLSIAAGIVLFLIPTGLATAPLASFSDGAGSLDMVEELCVVVDGRPTLIVDTEEAVSTYFLEPIRRWCGVPAAAYELAPGESLPEMPGGIILLSTDERLISDNGGEVVYFTADPAFIQERLLGAPLSIRVATVEVFVSVR